MPRSGMVPPLVTASRWAPGRPVSSSVVAVPDQPRPQLGERGRRIAPGEHVQDGVQRGVGQLGEGRGPADQRGQLVDLPGVQRHHRDDLLGQHVERVARVAQLLDRAVAHPLGHHRAGEQVAAVLGEHHAARHRADLVTGAADPLQPGGDRRRRLDLHDQVDRAHVDAQLQAGGGDHGGQLAGFQRLLDLLALLAGHAAVVRPGDHRWRARGAAGLGHHLGRHPRVRRVRGSAGRAGWPARTPAR